MTLKPGIHPALFILVCILAYGVMLFLVRRSTHLHRSGAKWFVTALRGVILAVLLFLLLDPVRRERAGEENRAVPPVVLLDTSASMTLGNPATRLARASAALEDLLSRDNVPKGATVMLYDADMRQQGGASGNALPETAEGKASNLGRALSRAVEQATGAGSGHVVVFSDGQCHDPGSLEDAVILARRNGVAVSAFPVGSGESEGSNADIRNCFVSRHAPPGTKVPVTVSLGFRNLEGRTVRLALRDGAGRMVDETEFAAADGTVEKTLALMTPAEPVGGLRRVPGTTPGDDDGVTETYVVELTVDGEETTIVDNRFAFDVKVAIPRIRVLYMEGSNHKDKRWQEKWEYEFITEALEETGTIEVTVLTVDEQLAKGGKLFNIAAPGEGFPETREDLFAYDVVICSDINRFIFTDEQLRATVDLVAEQGGGFCMIGGYTAFGAGGWDRTAWEQLIPVDMQTADKGYEWEDFVPRVPPETLTHPVWYLDADPERSQRIVEAHPPFKGTNLVNRAKPAATVLAYREKETMPVICVQSYGRGRTMAFTSDAAGGWGERYQTEWGEGERDNRHYRRFWVNAVRWLGENSRSRHRTGLIANTDAVCYRPGERVIVTAAGRNPDGQEETPGITVQALPEGIPYNPRTLLRDETDGVFKGTITLPEDLPSDTVNIRVTATDADGKEVGVDRISVNVLRMSREMADPEPNPDRLRDLARLTDGVATDTIGDIAAAVSRERAELRTREKKLYDVPLWDRTWLWAVVIALFSLEWLYRKAVRFGRI